MRTGQCPLCQSQVPEEQRRELERPNGVIRCRHCSVELMRNSFAGLLLDLIVLVPLAIYAFDEDTLSAWVLLGIAALFLSIYHKQLLWLFPLAVVDTEP